MSKYKSYDKIFKYKNIQNKKINDSGYDKLIKEKKNGLICKTLNLSNIKKPRNIFRKIKNNNFNYNKTIKNIFVNTEKIKLKKKGRNTVTIGNNNKSINLKVNNFFNDFKINNKNKRKEYKKKWIWITWWILLIIIIILIYFNILILDYKNLFIDN